MESLLFFHLLFWQLLQVKNFPFGASWISCWDRRPLHGYPPRYDDVPPFAIEVNETQVTSGQKMQVTIKSTSQITFKGFEIQARDDEDKFEGTWLLNDYCNLMDCKGGQDNSATHLNSSDKTFVYLEWVAGNVETEKEVQFITSVLYNYSTFWEDIKCEHKIKVLPSN